MPERQITANSRSASRLDNQSPGVSGQVKGLRGAIGRLHKHQTVTVPVSETTPRPEFGDVGLAQT
jgi:hypothetical protein